MAPDRDPLGTGTSALLDRGVAAGVITAAQRDALLALREEAPTVPPRHEPRRALDGVGVAYGVGAALVVFALAWFLEDRWRTLGPGGVLAVSLVYAALFALSATRLARAGFALAAGVAWALATLTAPLAAWSLLRLTGEWPDVSAPPASWEPYMATRRLVLELSTVLAALLLLRFLPAWPGAPRGVRRTPLAIPLAAAAGAALADVTTLLAIAAGDVELLMHLRGWAYATAGALLFGAAYVVDRRQRPPDDPGRTDFAGWLYLVACLVFEAGLLGAFDLAGAARHALSLVAVAQLAAAARLRRRTLIVAGMANLIWYLGYLAFDVFKGVLSFPLLLAAFGIAVLAVTVLVQRRFPALLRHVDDASRPPSLPGGVLTAWLPAVLAGALLLVAVPRARRRSDELARLQRAQQDSARAGLRHVPPSPPPR